MSSDLAVVAEAAKPTDPLKTSSSSSSAVSSQTQLQTMLSRSRLNTRLWLDCRLALARSLLSTLGALCAGAAG